MAILCSFSHALVSFLLQEFSHRQTSSVDRGKRQHNYMQKQTEKVSSTK